MNMDEDHVTRLRRMCGSPRDGALLRVSLANALLTQGNTETAVKELRNALQFDPDYSAAWKLLGKTLAYTGNPVAAIDAYRAGIAAASKRGDKQAQKEMQVFLRRLQTPDN